MLILYVGMKYDYGDPRRGYSFEHCNFFDSLRSMGHDLLYFDFITLLQVHGRDGMNRRLLEVADANRPTLMFTCLYTDQFDRSVIRNISEGGRTTTLNWFCDDHWRFDDFSKHWAPCFNWVVTTSSSAAPKYQQLGYDRAIKSQWACNPFLYRKLDLPYKFDVTFVGQPYGSRRRVVESLRSRGIDVRAWGYGWETGRLTQQGMIEVFNQSRINLNFAKAWEHDEAAGREARPRGLRARVGNLFRRLPLSTARRQAAAGDPAAGEGASPRGNGETDRDAPPDQIKGRNFEAPGCGGFLLTGRADDLENYFRIGSEVVCYRDVEDLARTVQYYLAHDEQRQAVADAGYRRTRNEHTYAHRFSDVFRRMGLLSDEAPADALERVAPGDVEVVD